MEPVLQDQGPDSLRNLAGALAPALGLFMMVVRHTYQWPDGLNEGLQECIPVAMPLEFEDVSAEVTDRL